MTRLPTRTRGPLRAHVADDPLPVRTGSRDADHEGTQGALDHRYGAALKLLRFPAVRERTGLSRSTMWRLERQGAFPPHHRISPNAVAWVEADIAKWIASKVAQIAV